jgi:hypothetical protein
MAEREKDEFVVTDRRKFRMEGDQVEHVEATPTEAATGPVREEAPATEPAAISEQQAAAEANFSEEPMEAPAPSAEDQEASQRAYQATSDRLDDLMRANNPGGQHEGPMTFDRVIQSLYVTAIVQLGLNTPAGQQMRVDLLGARHSIDMLGILAEKTKGNLTAEEEKLLQSALFELRMSFLEMTQALAQSAQSQAKAAGQTTGKVAPGAPPAPGKIIL